MIARACILSLALASACASDTVNPRPNDAVIARFKPAASGMPRFLDVPFPSDVYLQDGHIAEAIPGFADFVQSNSQYIEHELAQLDGFSRVAHAFFAIDDMAAKDDDGNVAAADIDPASLPARETDCTKDSSSVFFVDMTSGERIPCRASYHDDRKFNSPTRALLAVGPARGVVLEEAHPYAAVLTTRVKTTSGKNIQAADAFVGATGFWADKTKQAATFLGKALDGTAIVAIAPYTTNAKTRDLYDLRDALEKEPVPKLAWDKASMDPMGNACFGPTNGFTATMDAWLGVVDPKNKLQDGSDDPSNDLPVRAHDKVAAFATAVFQANYYLKELPGGYATLDHATFNRDANGKIIASATRPKQKIWVSFALPASPMPPNGYPTLIVQHGMGSSRAYLLDVMNELAKAGFLVAGIDSLTLGARAYDPAAQKDVKSSTDGAPGATYKGPDALSDAPPTAPIELFGELKNLGAFRDQLRQAMIDTAQLVRVLRSNPDLSPLAVSATIPKIDPDKVAYLGESLGSIEGEVACAIEPNLKAWFFSVGGGGIVMEAATHGPGLGSLLGPAAGANWQFLRDRFTESQALVNLIQTIIEPADALAYAPFLVKSPRPVAGKPPTPRNIALLEVIWDELVANEAGEALARAIGMGLATPNIGSNAGITSLSDPTKNTGLVPLVDVMPDGSGAFHDTPKQGTTAVVVQASPAGHGYDIVRKQAKRSYAIPYLRLDEGAPFFSLMDKAFWVRNPNLALMETIRRWFGTGFANGVPSAFVLAPPIRDFDDDGIPDDKDSAPNDPTR